MESEMHPAMRVDRRIVDGCPEYALRLSRANFNHLAAGCPEIDSVFGHSPSGTHFHITLGDRMPDAFRRVFYGTGMAYGAPVGVPAPPLPLNPTSEEIGRLSDEYSANLEKAINGSGRIPIMEPLLGAEKVFGYVRMEVER